MRPHCSICLYRHCLSYSILFCSNLCPSTVGSRPPDSYNFLSPLLCCTCPSLLLHSVISQRHFGLLTGLILTLYLPLCAFDSTSIIFHLGDVSSPFPFRIGYMLDSVYLRNDGVMDSVIWLDILAFSSPWHYGLFPVSLLMLL